MLGEVLNESGPYRIETATESCSMMGRFEVGDMVLDVRKLEPTSVGSSMYEFSDKRFPIFVEDIRKRNMQHHLEKMDTSRRSSRLASNSSAAASSSNASQRDVYVLSAKGKEELLKLTASDSSIHDRRDLRQMSR